MVDKVYPIGTKIRYISSSNGLWWRKGWEGTIVGIVDDFPLIYLPKSIFVSDYSTTECPATVQTSWDAIECVIQPNQQLLFAFMEE